MENLKYSYLEPRQKRLISPEVGLVISFFTVMFIFIIGVLIYLSFKIDMFKEQNITFNHEKKQTVYQTSLVQENIDIIEKSLNISGKLHKKNLFFLTSVKNILQLIPDKITLSKINISEDKLTLYGLTPTKDIYNLLMLAPLRSIFDKSFTSFYLEENGWYKFVSYNSMDENMTIFRKKRE